MVVVDLVGFALMETLGLDGCWKGNPEWAEGRPGAGLEPRSGTEPKAGGCGSRGCQRGGTFPDPGGYPRTGTIHCCSPGHHVGGYPTFASAGSSGGEATSSASESGSRQPARQEGSQGARQEPQSVGTASDPAGQVPRVRDDADRYTKEKFMKNGAKEFEGGIDPVKAENWINNMETTFRAMKVPPQHQTRLAIVMLGGEASESFCAAGN